MMNVILIIFTLSLLGLIILILGYSVLIWVLLRRKEEKRHIINSPKIYSVSIIVPVYNEQGAIERKIENLFAVNYDKDKMEVIFVDSASDDGTTELLRKIQCEERYRDKVKLILQPKRCGKAFAINEALKVARGEIIVLTDANAIFHENSLLNLCRNFDDPGIGAVGGKLSIPPDSFASSLYSSFFDIFRNNVRISESKLDCPSFFSGELIGFRRGLIDKLDDDAISDDLDLLIKVRKKEFRCIIDEEALVWERRPAKFSEHLVQQRRTTAGTLQIIMRNKDMLFNRKYGLFGSLILPAYLLRLILIPIFLLLLEITGLGLFFDSISSFINIIFEKLILSVPIFAVIIFSGVFHRKLLPVFLFSIIAQIAILLGMMDYLRGKHTHLWKKVSTSRVMCD